MSLVKMSCTRNYWSADFRIPQVADTMTLNRYEDLKRFIHFADKGYKLWVLCGASGYAYDFEVYIGKGENVVQEGEADCGASGNVVIRLARSIPTGITISCF